MAPITDLPPLPAEARELDENKENSHDSEFDIQGEAESGTNSEDEAPDLENTLSRVSSGPPYSVFSPGMRRWIVALAPTIFGDFGDIAGRRPTFIITFTIYLGANIGLALQRNYAALLVLRMLQSGGSSGTIALVYAVVADIVPTSERGKWMGIVGSGITIGPAIGPVIGFAHKEASTAKT
ncbi:hypothetical protein FHL15_010224 [Xylaria flabelliformis]|uniref:Major facilitator superfamily (MFS) profile domain-containing protein n=1 Tax=Xylaria flabelliformis TaxID=2512241 RepID=A0A553HLQ1_9PEZI|nr:hypothetical protein FHL15_010224 [Xylaria flabelliformis]